MSREKPMHWSGEGADKFAEGGYDKLVIFFSPSEAEQVWIYELNRDLILIG